MQHCRRIVHAFCLKTIRDVRRMHSSLYFPSCPSLNVHITKQDAQIYQSVKATFCKMANHEAYNQRKIVRFEINNNTDNNNDTQQLNDDRKRACNGPNGVGTCKSGLEGSRVEISTSSADTISTKLRATTNDNDGDNDNDNDKARRATPLVAIIHPQTVHPA